MALRLAMYDASYDHIRERLAALNLDIAVSTFNKQGVFDVDGRATAPADLDVDYLWLSTHINADGFRDAAFGLALACRSVGVLQTFNAGLDHPFYQAISAKGTRICNSSAQGVAIAEYIFGQVLSVFQPIQRQRDLQAGGTWQTTPFREISETNWLIIGFGPIGREVAARAKAFGARVDVIRRSHTPAPPADTIGTIADLPRLLPTADVIVLACPLNADTRNIAGPAFFEAVKPGATLVNIARGAVVDDAAMLAALDSGRLATAILDVFVEEPLPRAHRFWTHPRIRLTSHTSNAGSGSRARWDRLFLDNIQRFATGLPLAQEVDPKDIG